MARSIRVFGNGGLFAVTGIYRNRKLGTYRAYVTDRKLSVVLRTRAGKSIVVSPERPEAFLATLRARYSGLAEGPPRLVPRSGTLYPISDTIGPHRSGGRQSSPIRRSPNGGDVQQPQAQLSSILTVLEVAHPGAEDALQITRELIEALPVPIFYKARDGRYLGVNRAWEDFFGVSRETIVGSRVETLYEDSPAVAARHRHMDEELWANPGSQSYEITLFTRDGHLRHTLYYKATFRGADGEVSGLIGTIIDITERKQVEHRQAIEGSVAALLDHAGTVAEAITATIEEMCTRFDWACGARWSLDEHGEPPALRREVGRERARRAALPRRRGDGDLRAGRRGHHPQDAQDRRAGVGRGRRHEDRFHARAGRRRRRAARRLRAADPARRAGAGCDRVLRARAAPPRGMAAAAGRARGPPDRIAHGAARGRGAPARGARGARVEGRRALALQRRAAAVRLRRLPRPAGAAAHDLQLHAAPGAALRRPLRRERAASSWASSSRAPGA